MKFDAELVWSVHDHHVCTALDRFVRKLSQACVVLMRMDRNDGHGGTSMSGFNVGEIPLTVARIDAPPCFQSELPARSEAERPYLE